MSNPFDQFDAGNPFDAFDPPGTIAGTINSVRRGMRQAGQTVDAATIALGAGMATDADQEPARVAQERLEDPEPQREHFDRYGEDADRVYTVSLQKWQMRNAARDERLRNNARFAEGMRKDSIPQLAGAIGRRQGEIAAIPQTEGKQQFDDSQSLGGALAAVARHPIDTVAGVAAESLPASAPSLVLGALGSAAGPAGTMMGAGAGSFASEYGSKVMDELQAAGVDFQKPETIAAVIQDPERMAAIREKSVRRGVPVALFDAVSSGIAGRLLRSPGKTMAAKLGHAAAEIGIQGAMGGAGEAAGSIAAGDQVSGRDVLAEMLGELGSGTQEIVTGHVRDRVLGERPALDTGKNVPESDATLQAQQEQLLAGRRPAQMFPVDADGNVPNELPLPKGMKRVETERGVFHYNPQLVTADEIFSASAKGRENDLLALGPASKADVERRAAAGEPRLSLMERQPDGTEVKTALATPGTAPATTAALEATKTPGNTVTTEPLGTAVGERRGFVGDLLAKDAQQTKAQQEAAARESIERTVRQRELDAKKARFDETLGAARALAQQPAADFPALNGALQSVRFYADDNSLGLAEPQRQAARTAVAYLEKRAAAAKPTWEATQAQAKEAAATAAAAKDAEQRQARTDAKKDFKTAAAQGVAADGSLDYSRMTANRLAELAQTGDKRAERALMARESAPADERESLIDAMRTVKLPANDAALGGELATLIREEMTPQQRRQLVSEKMPGLDRMAEALRERGFSTIQTPADVIDHVQRALRGEDVRADHAAVEDVAFAAAKRSTLETTVRPDAIEKPVPIIATPGKTLAESVGARITNEDTGREITVPRSAAKKQISNPSPEAEANTPELLRTMRLVSSEPDNAGRQNIVAIHRFVGAVRAEDNVLPVRVTVREMRGGEMILRHIESAEELARPVGTSDVGPGSRQPASLITGRISHPASPENPTAPGGMRSPTVRELLRPVKGEDGNWRAQFADAPKGWESVGGGDYQAPRGLTDAEAEREMAAIRMAFPELTREYDIEVGLVEDAMRRRGYRGQVPAAVQAAVLRLRAQRSLIVLASRAYRDRAKGAALLTHEVAHTYWDTLPNETRAQLRDLHAREVAEKSGPLYRDGQLQSELAYVEDQNENGHQEWFAERIARLNEAWAKGQIDRSEHALLVRMAYQVREFVQHIWSTIALRDGIDPDSELFVRDFRRFFAGGADQEIGQAAGSAYAQRNAASFATGKDDAKKIINEAARIEPLPTVDRKAALMAELKRARAMRDEGIKTGNWDAEKEGQARVSQMTRLLDDEFSGWDSPPREDAAPPAPPSTTESASPDDGEPSPFSGDEPMPVRAGKWNEVYGQDGYQPTALARSWARVRDVISGIKGAIPELPTFPAAAWNKTDAFIRDHGSDYYNRVKEGLRALRSGNDYVQRTAEEQVARIVRPLIEAGGKFDANDYARLRRAQETARRLRADERPVPSGLRARIAALNSKLESSPYVLFNRLVLALDLHWRQQNLTDSEGNPIALPANVNAAETTAELQRLGERIEASEHAELIKTALREHMALVKQVAEDLKGRELLAGDHLANPYYFPHITLETTRGGKTEQRELRVERVRPGTEADFRGYLIDPVGSAKPISTDYVRSLYYHLVQVGAHNLHADVVRDFFRPYDVKAKVEARAKELSKERGVPVSWQQAFHEEFAPAGYVLYGTDSRDAFPSIEINRDALARRLGVMLTSEDLQKQLHALGLKGIKLLPEDLQETLQQGAKETWIVPARVAEALRGVADRESRQDDALGQALRWALGKWKAWKLFMPWNHIRYEYGNVVADLEKLLSADPRTFKYLPAAAKELRDFWQGGAPSDDLRAALKEGVINAITAQEMGGLSRTKAFEAFQTRAEKAWATFKQRGSSALLQPITTPLGLGDFSTPELSALREAITRYAKFRADLEAIRAGSRPHYAGAYWRDIEGMKDSAPGANDVDVRKAAAISKATFGDYGDLSVLGTTLRDKFIPFYSWMEINFRYHANLMRNLRDMVRIGEASRGEAATAGARAAAVFAAGFTARAAGGIVLRLALPYVAAAMWNNSGDRDDLEKLLSEEDRRRFHIILGERKDGNTTLRDGRKIEVVYGQTAFMDVAKWISGPKFVQSIAGWMNGKTDFPTAFSAWRDELVPDFVNNLAGSAGPYFKLPYTLASKKNPFPDVLDQRTIPSYDMRRIILGQLTDDFTADQVERVINKDYYGSKDLGDWAKQLVLQVRQRDPEAWAFYEIKDKAADFLERRTGASRDTSFDAPDQQVLRNFRRAIYRGDVEKATQFYLRLLDYGYTSERFTASIRAQEPLSGLPKALRKEFVSSLSEFDREQLERAYEFYTRMSGARGHERQLFPSQRWGEGAQQRFQTHLRTDRLENLMDRRGDMSDEEVRRRADLDLRRSLQKR